MVHLARKAEERSACIIYATVRFDRIGQRQQDKEGQVAPSVAEGCVGPVKTKDDVQQALQEGVEGRKKVAGDGVQPTNKAPGRPQSQGFLADGE